MYNKFSEFLKDKNHLCIIQAENPDGDSLGSALGLYEILTDKDITLYCPVNIPKYLRYFPNWGNITDEFDFDADGYIVVDTASSILLSKLLEDPAINNALNEKPVFVIDHHETPDDLDFPHELITDPKPSCTNVIYNILIDQHIPINPAGASNLLAGLSSDTLGLTTPSVTADTFHIAEELTKLGANIAKIEEARREFMKKSQRILDYKGDLIKRIEYHLDGQLATVHITWDDIAEYSDEYNPGVLIIDEMRMVEGVKVAIAIKTYPDGKATGKVRTSSPFADQLAGFFGGGGHPYASGFRTYDATYESVVHDLLPVVDKLLKENENAETV
jgi:phosphoesterase RecJ-like protein